MKPTLSEVKTLVDQLAKIIDAPEKSLPTYGNSIDNGHPFIEIESGVLFYSAKERGEELYRYIAFDMDDLLYHVFEDISFMIAIKYELKNRIKGQDFRRIAFDEQERLLGILNETWSLRKRKEHNNLLMKHPFDDNASERATYYQQLVKSGQHTGKEWLIASEKYPQNDKKG